MQRLSQGQVYTDNKMQRLSESDVYMDRKMHAFLE
jgi:hypothetical protein